MIMFVLWKSHTDFLHMLFLESILTCYLNVSKEKIYQIISERLQQSHKLASLEINNWSIRRKHNIHLVKIFFHTSYIRYPQGKHVVLLLKKKARQENARLNMECHLNMKHFPPLAVWIPTKVYILTNLSRNLHISYIFLSVFLPYSVHTSKFHTCFYFLKVSMTNFNMQSRDPHWVQITTNAHSLLEPLL